MRSKELSLERYATDKVTNGYLDWYDPNLEHLVDREITLLEIGVLTGGSLRLWRDYFPKGHIVGVDVVPVAGFAREERIQFFQGSQGHESFLNSVAETTAPNGFDIIIDDGAHIGALSQRTFSLLFDKHLKPSGLYVIEDWGTGYWEDWPDGRAFTSQPLSTASWKRLFRRGNSSGETTLLSHTHGMVGFIKELVDEQGAADRTRGRSSELPQRPSKFAKMVITPSVVFITKRAAETPGTAETEFHGHRRPR